MTKPILKPKRWTSQPDARTVKIQPSEPMNKPPSGKSRIKSVVVIVPLLCCVASLAFGLEPLRITLGPHAKKEAQEIAKIRRIPLCWQVIADHPDYPSDDVIVAALTVNDPQLKPPLPAKPAEQDCTETVQDAIDQVWANGGGTVFLPAGEYRFNGSLNVRSRVTLLGQWNLPTPSAWKPGTVLKIMTTGAADKGSPFLTLQSSAAN